MKKCARLLLVLALIGQLLNQVAPTVWATKCLYKRDGKYECLPAGVTEDNKCLEGSEIKDPTTGTTYNGVLHREETYTDSECDKQAAVWNGEASTNGFCYNKMDSEFCVAAIDSCDLTKHTSTKFYTDKATCLAENVGIWCANDAGECHKFDVDKTSGKCSGSYINGPYKTESECTGHARDYGYCAYTRLSVTRCLKQKLPCPSYIDMPSSTVGGWNLKAGPFDDYNTCNNNKGESAEKTARLAELKMVDTLEGSTLDTLNPLSGADAGSNFAAKSNRTVGKFLTVLMQDYVFPLAALLLILLLVYGGFLTVSGAATSNSSRVEAGMKRASVAVIGFILLAGSYVIWTTLLKILGID